MKRLSFIILSGLSFLIFISFQGFAMNNSDFSTAEQTSKVFTSTAKKVIPTVVFIKVEQSIEAGSGLALFQFKNTFDLYGNDIFEYL